MVLFSLAGMPIDGLVGVIYEVADVALQRFMSLVHDQHVVQVVEGAAGRIQGDEVLLVAKVARKVQEDLVAQRSLTLWKQY